MTAGVALEGDGCDMANLDLAGDFLEMRCGLSVRVLRGLWLWKRNTYQENQRGRSDSIELIG